MFTGPPRVRGTDPLLSLLVWFLLRFSVAKRFGPRATGAGDLLAGRARGSGSTHRLFPLSPLLRPFHLKHATFFEKLGHGSKCLAASC
jgi:hypothetical protein